MVESSPRNWVNLPCGGWKYEMGSKWANKWWQNSCNNNAKRTKTRLMNKEEFEHVRVSRNFNWLLIKFHFSGGCVCCTRNALLLLFGDGGDGDGIQESFSFVTLQYIRHFALACVHVYYFNVGDGDDDREQQPLANSKNTKCEWTSEKKCVDVWFPEQKSISHN